MMQVECLEQLLACYQAGHIGILSIWGDLMLKLSLDQQLMTLFLGTSPISQGVLKCLTWLTSDVNLPYQLEASCLGDWNLTLRTGSLCVTWGTFHLGFPEASELGSQKYFTF